MHTLKLKKDLVIPAGTIFTPAPVNTERGENSANGEGHYQYDVGIGKDNTAAVVIYYQNDEVTNELCEVI